ncbi:GSCOCG00009702001-RA-CDS [Cotesia congregata]|nr:GSCOCG00009702001-RA-CDS [Cotesia congregata]
MSAIIIPEHVLFRIFKYMDPITLLKLRKINKYLKELIEQDFGIWRRLILKTSEITPWKDQLINLRYPYIKSENYNSLTSEEYQELFFEFIKLSRAKNVFCVNKLSVIHPSIKKENEIFFDARGNYFGYFSRTSNYLALFRLDTSEMLIEPVNIFKYANAQVADPDGRWLVQQFMMWCPNENRLFLIFVHVREGLVILDALQRRRMKTPTLISVMPITSPHGHFTFFNLVNNSSGDDIYTLMPIEDTLYHIVRLRWATKSQNLVAESVVLFESPSGFLGMTPMSKVDNSTVSLIYKYQNKDVLYQAKVPETIISPIRISRNSGIEIFMNNENRTFNINAHNSQIFTVIDQTRNRLRIALKLKNGLIKEKSYQLPISENDHVAFVKIFINNLFIFTIQGIVKVYRLKNPMHLLHLTFDDPPNLKLTLETDINFENLQYIKIALKNDKLCLICLERHGLIHILPFQ